MTFFPPLLPWPFQFHKQHWVPAGRVVRRQHAARHLPRLFDALGQLEYHPSTLRGIDLVKLRGEGSRFFGCPFFRFLTASPAIHPCQRPLAGLVAGCRQ